LKGAWVIIRFEFDSYKSTKISGFIRKEFYLEFLVLFIHLDPKTNWSKIEDGHTLIRKTRTKLMHMNLGGL